jgi:hypothetical protein
MTLHDLGRHFSVRVPKTIHPAFLFRVVTDNLWRASDASIHADFNVMKTPGWPTPNG